MKLSMHRWIQALGAMCALLVLSAIALAEGGPAQLTGVKYTERGEQAELELTLSGQVTVEVEPLAASSGFLITLNGTQPGVDLKIPTLAKTAALTALTQKASQEGDDPLVQLTAKLADASFELDQLRVDTTQAGVVRVIWAIPLRDEPPAPKADPKPQAIPAKSVAETDLLNMGSATPVTTIEDIAIDLFESGEMVVVTTDQTFIPVVREAAYPRRLVLELEAGVLADALVDSFVYEDTNALIQKVDLVVQPKGATGILQIWITAPAMERYDVAELGNGRTAIRVYGATAPVVLPEPAPMPMAKPTPEPTPVVAPAPEPLAEPPAQVEEAPAPVTAAEKNSDAMDEALARMNAKRFMEEGGSVDPDSENSSAAKPEKAAQTYALGMGDTEPALEAPVGGGMDYSATMGDFEEYPDLPLDETGLGAEEGTWGFPAAETQDPSQISDAIVSLNFVSASFIDVMMILAQQAGVNFVLDAYWNQTPTGHVRERQPGGPGGDPQGGGAGGFNPGGGFGAAAPGSVTMFLQEVPFDQAFAVLMQANNLDYKVFRDSPDSEPLLFISTRERLEGELGLGVIRTYQLHYIPPEDAYNFLYQMDLLPSTGDFGVWFYGGGGNTGGGGGQGGGGGGGRGGGGSGGGRGGGGGGGFNMPSPNGPNGFGLNTGQPVGFDGNSYAANGQLAGGVGASGSFYGMVNPSAFQFNQVPGGGFSPMQGGAAGGGGGGGQGGGGGGGGGGGFGGGGGGGQGGGGGGGGQYTAKPGAIGIMATAELHEQIAQALGQVDKPPRQVYVEATFLTFDDNPNQVPDVFGLDNFGSFAIETGGDRFPVQFDATGAEGLVFSILPKNQRLPFDDFRARYQYLFSDRKAKIVTAPRVAVIDGQTATVGVTENRPFIIDGGVIIDQFGNAVPAPDIVIPVQTGTFLTITPYIDDFGNITMALNPQINSLLGEPQLINGNLVFGTSNTQVNTTLRLRDGETIVIGGLTRRDKDVNRQYVPFLGDIPIIGKLFGREEVIEVDSQLVVLITTHLVGS